MKNNNLIALHSQECGGKDEVAKIINFLVWSNTCSIKHEHKDYDRYKGLTYDNYQNKKFATPLKQICAILTGTKLEQWEDRKFKNTEINWNRTTYSIAKGKTIWDDNEPSIIHEHKSSTPRQIMQDVGEAMRNINPDVFVNALFRDYKPQCLTTHHNYCGKLSMANPDNPCSDEESAECLPMWVISDLRFDNERLAIQKRNGILVKIERDLYYYEDSKVTWDELIEIIYKNTGEYPTKNYADLHWKVSKSTHHSENSLNHFKDWDYIIDNSKDIPHLINEVEKMLKHFKVI